MHVNVVTYNFRIKTEKSSGMILTRGKGHIINQEIIPLSSQKSLKCHKISKKGKNPKKNLTFAEKS